VFQLVNDNLVVADDKNEAVTLELNTESSNNLIYAVGNFSAVPAVNAVAGFQASLRLHTMDNFDFIQPQILRIWTVRGCVSLA
jgi:hypothetical protein